jgi:hypothetical protein
MPVAAEQARASLATDPSKRMRFRCPADDAEHLGDHLALDIHLPLGLDGLSFVCQHLPECICGKELFIWLPASDK